MRRRSRTHAQKVIVLGRENRSFLVNDEVTVTVLQEAKWETVVVKKRVKES